MMTFEDWVKIVDSCIEVIDTMTFEDWVKRVDSCIEANICYIPAAAAALENEEF